MLRRAWQEPEPEPEPSEGAAEEQPEPGRPGGLGAAELEFIAWAGGYEIL